MGVATVPSSLAPGRLHRVAGALAGQGHFRRNVALLIVFISVVATLVGWRASEWSGRAADGRQRALGMALLREQAVAHDRSLIMADLRALGPYAQHMELAHLLRREVGVARRRGQARRAEDLRVAALGEQQLAAQTKQFTVDPTVRAGRVHYDARAALAEIEQDDQSLLKYDPTPLRASAARAQRKAVDLAGIATLFVAALVFATLAQITREGLRERFALAAFSVAMGAEVLFLVR
jgi:hypothetical protein